MPHLDANALTTDVDGLDFLKDVLGTSTISPRSAFDTSRATKRTKRVRPLDAGQDHPRRRRGVVTEAA